MKNIYKDTLLIGQTDFDMRAGLKDKEPVIQEMWDAKKIYDQKQKLNEGKPLFMLHDGPPYANGDLHIGHALNKTLKDMIIRWKNANGYLAPFIMGWDTHGLPIETAVTKMGIDRKQTPAVEFRDMCKDYALKQVANQANQFKRLGIFSNSDVKYVTLTHDFEVSELRLFQKMYEKEMVYKALKPIYWSPSSESALAESEIEYKDIKSPTIFVAMKIVEGNAKIDTDTEIVIWTTTPWTIPSNQMAAVGENIEYSIVKANDRKFILASSLVNKVAEQIGWETFEILDTLKGPEIVGVKYAHPLYEQKNNLVVIGHHVTDEAGTGIVHTAGGFGEDDYIIVKQHGIEPFAPIDDQGKFTNEIAEFDEKLVGVFYEDANKLVGMDLEAKQRLLKLKFVSHSYPHDWRTKKPVIYRCTSQWFIGLDKAKNQILANVDQITTKPEWAKKRLYQVLEDRTDWTISRQRLWGVPIVAFYDQNDKLVLNNEILAFAIDKIAELGTNAWFDKPADTFLPEAYRNKDLRKEKDILDVWFDSGSSAIALSERFKNLPLPYDLYLEGNDQYRGWFNASMINSTIYSGKSPYKKLISHGMTVDEKGNKMSKSLGNGIDPIEFANTQGADILRLWVASTDYTDDQKIGPEIIKQIGESYRKIRNTMRFILANLFDFDPSKDYQTNLTEVDRYALNNLSVVKNKASEAYDNLSYNQVYNLVVNYVTKDLSSFYLDFIKDILYIEKNDSIRRRQVQTVLYEQLWMLIDLLRPILIHTIEEVYQAMVNLNKTDSVHLLDNKKQDFIESNEFVTKWNNIMVLRDDVNKALEIAREQKIINKGFEAIVKVCLKDEFKNIESTTELEKIFIVNSLSFTNDCSGLSEQKIAFVGVELKNGVKCERCWGIFDTLINNEICERCNSVVESL
ncbi:Isoleucyl-tRNA synthetase [Mesoplasma florum W37]|uniref:Isoleucine--tRNA ligase n=1 Tax=Mesoplasma florum TaxID=2151 RepID=A0AAD0HS68_MESFO|nr:isoleucine--tRNA ligase [Mesoplasma florum]AGY41479.1 Isoleucyl-tRNA synthetase [Mesoplasma florum W37]AVN59695.1 isoleucine--tRNA ligase [Mesoplasma florum]AVN65818.1 Isoleucyl-tRNA synthetase [Mesoplasma florum]